MKYLLLLLLLACAPLDTSTDDHAHENLGRTFGPGLGPQTHKISLRQFERVQDIAPSNDLPEPINRKTPTRHIINLTAKEVVSDIAPNITYLYWTFNETVPGPFLRIREGDTVELSLHNHHTSGHNHSIDLHAVNGPGGGAGATEVAPGETKTFTFKALNPGLYVYHCATQNVPTHMANGMYGLILVEPKSGYSPVDAEFTFMQGELYTSGTIGEQGIQHFDGNKMLSEQPEYIVFNGRPGALVEKPFSVKTNSTVRLFVGNGGVAKSSNFHVIGEIFDTVYAEGGTDTIHNVQTTNIPAGGATIVEFKVEVPGKYVLVDHALARLDRGAFGILEAHGPANPDVFSGQTGISWH